MMMITDQDRHKLSTHHMCTLGTVDGGRNAAVAAQHLLHVFVLLGGESGEADALPFEYLQPVSGRELVAGGHEVGQIAARPRLLHPSGPHDAQPEGDGVLVLVPAGRVAD